MSAPPGIAGHHHLIERCGALRVVNWHTTPPSAADRLREQLRALRRRWDPLDLAGLDAVFDGEHRARPAFAAVFYEGYAEHVDVAAAVCAEVGVTAWFAVCTGFVDCPVPEQEVFARAHWIALTGEHEHGGRLAMTWDEVAQLSRDHVVFPHTATHAGIADTVTDADLRREVTDPKRVMDAVTGQDAPLFAWMGGTPWGASTRHDDAVRRAGHRYVLSNTALQRIA